VSVAVACHPDIFAANRASGRITLDAKASGGVTRRARVHEAGSLRVRFPNVADGALEAVIVNTGGGMTGGDRFSIGIAVDEDARLVAGTAAAEKIYRSTGRDAEVDISIKIGAGGRLAWLPQETILFDRARLSRRITVDLAANASLLMAEAVVFGRTAMGEAMQAGHWSDHWRVRRGGKLVFAENARLDGAVADRLRASAVANDGIALATVLIAPGDEKTAAALRVLALQGEAGASSWNGIAVARLIARDGLTLRRDLTALIAALDQPLPRLWLQ